MKELSIEEKAKAYDEAIERAKVFKEHLLEINEKDYADEMDYIFPKLVESEDEKTKRILHSISSKISFHLCDIFTEEEFHCFDAWSNAWLEKQGNLVKYYEDKLDKCACDNFNKGYKKALEKQGEQKPTEVRTTGYWHVEDVEQKSAWSKEDEQWWKVIAQTELTEASKDWIRTLINKVTSQLKQEWSEEDEQYLEDTLTLLEGNRSVHTYGEVKNWLKFLKDRFTWKPSSLQIEALESATENCAYSEYQDCLRELIGQLKKLRER